MVIDSEIELFERKLQELYYVERRLDDFQARLAEEAIGEELEDFFMGHHEATSEQLDRIEDIFEEINAEPNQRESGALDELITEREALIEDADHTGFHDVINAETARATERLEVTKLESLLVLAGRLDLEPSVRDPLRASRTEAENAIERIHELPLG